MAARGSAEWQGTIREGSGTFTAGDSLGGEYSFKSRFEDGPGANPEQLIAGAHASCFSMALSLVLEEAGTPVESVKTDAKVTIRMLEEGPTITRIELSTVGRVPGADQADRAGSGEGGVAGVDDAVRCRDLRRRDGRRQRGPEARRQQADPAREQREAATARACGRVLSHLQHVRSPFHQRLHTVQTSSRSWT